MQEVTRSILDLVSARQNLAQLIAQVKESSGAEVENHSVEERLSSEMIAYARSIGLDEHLANMIVLELIKYSKIAQRKKIYLNSIRTHLRTDKIKTVTIFGAGRMGGWFASYFIEAGAKVLLFDSHRRLSRSKARELGCEYAGSFEEAARADLVLIAVPIKATPREVRRLVRFSKENPNRKVRILEISSIKSEMENAGLIQENKLPKNVALHSIHPLFGPTADPFSVNSLIQIGIKSPFVHGIFPQYQIFHMSVRNHDQLMSTMLTIPHAHALSFANLVVKRKKTIPENIGSPSFDHLLELSNKTLKENRDVYYEIQATNPYADRAITDTMGSIRKIRSLLRDKKAFRKFFDETGRALN